MKSFMAPIFVAAFAATSTHAEEQKATTGTTERSYEGRIQLHNMKMPWMTPNRVKDIPARDHTPSPKRIGVPPGSGHFTAPRRASTPVPKKKNWISPPMAEDLKARGYTAEKEEKPESRWGWLADEVRRRRKLAEEEEGVATGQDGDIETMTDEEIIERALEEGIQKRELQPSVEFIPTADYLSNEDRLRTEGWTSESLDQEKFVFLRFGDEDLEETTSNAVEEENQEVDENGEPVVPMAFEQPEILSRPDTIFSNMSRDGKENSFDAASRVESMTERLTRLRIENVSPLATSPSRRNEGSTRTLPGIHSTTPRFGAAFSGKALGSTEMLTPAAGSFGAFSSSLGQSKKQDSSSGFSSFQPIKPAEPTKPTQAQQPLPDPW